MSISLRVSLVQNAAERIGIEWHPIHHSLFVTGDSAGTINYYSLTDPDPSEPVTSLVEAHEDAIFTLAFHPLGHLLCSGSKDFTARFWARARPAGGQESDRWHVGEAKALEMKAEGRTGVPMRVWGGGDKKEEDSKRADGGLPGLPGLSNLANMANVNMPPPAQPSSNQYGANGGGGGLPGFGARQNGGSSGGGGSGGAGWQRSQALPSQDEARSAPARTGAYDDRGPPPRREYGSNRNGRDMSDGPSRSGPYDRAPPPQSQASGGYGPPGGGYGNNNGPPPPAQYGGMPPPASAPYPVMNASRPPPPPSMPPFAAGRPPFPPAQYPPLNQGYPPTTGSNYPPPPQQGGFRPPPPPPSSQYGRPPPNQGGSAYGGGYGR